MMDINWPRILIASVIVEVPLIPLLWRDYLPGSEKVLRQLRTISRLLLAPIILFSGMVLHISAYDAIPTAIFIVIFAGIQAIFLALMHSGKKRSVREIVPILLLSVLLLVLAALGVFFFLIFKMPIFGIVFMTGVILIAVIMIIRAKKLRRHKRTG